MAINTEDRRRSAGGIGVPGYNAMPVADNAVDAEDRRHVAGLFRGPFGMEPSPLIHGKQIRDATLELVVFSALVKSVGGDYTTLGAALQAFEDSPSRFATIDISGVV